MKILRRVLIALLGVFLLVVVAGVVFLATFDVGTLRPRIEAAAETALGRQIALSGPITVKYSLIPTIQVENVELANIDGGSRPQMATLKRLELEIRLLPLLSRRVEIDRLVLVEPDILLEVMPDGRANWQLGSDAAPSQEQAPVTEAGEAPRESKTPVTLDIADIRIENGRVALHDMRTGRRQTADIANLRLGRQVAGDIVFNGVTLGLRGQTGPLGALLAPTREPWPLDLTLTAGAARLAVRGAIADPRHLRGWQIEVQTAVPDLAALAPLVPDTELPALHDVKASGTFADGGGAWPRVSAIDVQIGASDLSAFLPGLRVERVEIAAPALDQPVRIAVRAQMHDAPVGIDGTVTGIAGSPATVALNWQVAGAQGDLQGTIADPAAVTGVDLALRGQVSDLAATGAALRMPLPAVKGLSLAARIAERGPAFAGGAVLRDIRIDSPHGDLSGETTLIVGDVPGIEARLASAKLDLDALLATLNTQPETPEAPAAQSSEPAAAPAPDEEPADQGVPFDALHQGRGKLDYTAGEVRFGGETYRQVALSASLRDGVLRVEPLTLTGPAGRMELRGSADAAKPATPVALMVRAPGLAVAPVLRMLGQPNSVSGNADVNIDVRAEGRTQRALLSTLSGTVGVAMPSGRIENRFLNSFAGNIIRALGAGVSAGGASQINCAALRLQIDKGVAQTRVLMMSTELVDLDGSGAFNLPRETMALRVHVATKTGTVRVNAPVMVSGSFRAPQVGVDRQAAASALGGVIGGLANRQSGSDLFGALLGGAGQPSDNSCARGLAIARGVTPPPAAAPAPAQQPPAAGTPGQRVRPRDLLRGLIR